LTMYIESCIFVYCIESWT